MKRYALALLFLIAALTLVLEMTGKAQQSPRMQRIDGQWFDAIDPPYQVDLIRIASTGECFAVAVVKDPTGFGGRYGGISITPARCKE